MDPGRDSLSEYLPTRFLDFRPALSDFELWVCLANDVDASTPFDDLAIGVTVLQGTDTADDFHRIARNLSMVYGVLQASLARGGV